MKRLQVVLLAVAVGVAMSAAVWSPGMAQRQPSSPTPTSYKDVAYAPGSDTQNITVDAAPVAFRTAAGQGQSAGAVDCGALAERDFSALLPDARVKVTSASDVAATATDPAYCEVAGTVASNAQFVVQLPTDGWTGQYFQSGCGGYCGNLNPNEDCQAAFGRGAAIGYSDLGTTGMDDLSWALDEGTRLNFAYAANHELAVGAKAIIAAYYGQSPAHNYFIGCSDGGREALMEAQRFPDDFDGIVAGAPAYLLAFLNTFKHAWEYRANTDADGNPIITEDKATVLHDAVLAECDELDGVADGLLFDPRDCAFDPGTLLCPDDVDASDCLTQEQVDAARKLYSAPVDERGVRYYPGGTLPYGSELRWSGLSFGKNVADSYAGYLSQPLPQQDTSQNADTIQFQPGYFDSLLPMSQVYDASNPDLSAFRDRGGKLILYHGWADDSISPTGTIAYHAALEQQMGGPEATQRFARLFMFPGVYHCSGGYGPSHWDMATPIADWVEGGVAPTQIVASEYESDATAEGGGFQDPNEEAGQASTDRVVRTLPAYPYPLRPQYTGSGDVNDAQNYVPVLPTVPTDDDIDWIGRGQISPAGSGTLPSSGGPPLVPVVLVGGSIVVLVLMLVARGLRALARLKL